MKKWLLGGAVVIAASLLSGCYVAPGYSYVRDGYGGDAYYGRGTTVYDDGYYAPDYYAPGYYRPGYYGGYGYPGGVSVGIGATWYGHSRDRYRHRDDDRRDHHHGDDHRGQSWGHSGARDDHHGWSGSRPQTGRSSHAGRFEGSDRRGNRRDGRDDDRR